MRVLLTAIGSMSAECAINKLKEKDNYVVGCDIYPKEWHYESFLCNSFYQAPLATKEAEYIQFLLNICKKEQINYLIPLTDLEIDAIDRNRDILRRNNVIICTQSSSVLKIVRNKFALYKFFENDPHVLSLKTFLLSELQDFTKISYPCVAKPYNGRSSEGLIKDVRIEQLAAINNKEDYIIQEQKQGDIFTVDYCRCEKTKQECAVPRKELLRTKNGAGLTIKISKDKKLIDIVSYIGRKLGINGCVNMEFIYCDGEYYLIDINPRFSAGIAFTSISGYDIVNNHLNCFCNKSIDNPITLEENIIYKKYKEVFINNQ